jgi:hypothetical protein
VIVRVNELDRAVQRHHEAARARSNEAATLLTDFADRMRRWKVAPLRVGYYRDMGATGLFGQRRAASFQQRDTGWVLPRKLDGMYVSTDGRLYKGPSLYIVAPGQKKCDLRPDVSFYFPPKDGFAYCFNQQESHWLASATWTFREVSDVTGYVNDLAAALVSHGD